MIKSISDPIEVVADAEAKRGVRRRKLAPRATSIDRLPPHSLEAEQGVLGCCLLDPVVCVAETVTALRDELAFYDLRHQVIFKTLADMANKNDRIDLITVQQNLKDRQLLEQVGGIAYLSELQDKTPSAANLSYYLKIVSDKATLRRLISTCTDYVGRVYDFEGEVGEIVAAFEKSALGVSSKESELAATIDNKAALQKLSDMYDRACVEGQAQGIQTGFDELDRMTGGMMPGQMIVIAARPSIGKTSIALSITEKVALIDGLPVGWFSLEMSGEALLHRASCSLARVNGLRLKNGTAGEDDYRAIRDAQVQLSKAPIYICDRTGLTVQQIAARARRMVQQYGVQLFIVDYLGFVLSGQRGLKRCDETTLASNGLKFIGKELGVPMIVLAQLNRELEKDKRAPRLADLRDSGAVEQDADWVALLHRDEDQTEDIQTINLILAKQRDGPTGKIDLTFHRSITRYENKVHEQPPED